MNIRYNTIRYCKYTKNFAYNSFYFIVYIYNNVMNRYE